MSLKDIVLPKETVEFSGGTFAVRGLSFNDVLTLVNDHRPAIEPLFLQAISGGLPTGDQFELGMMLVEKAPDVVAQAVALAADEPDAAEMFKKLPIDVQLDAIERVMRVTFALVGDPKKFVQTLLRIVESTKAVGTDLKR
jgi:hypothetical protein